MIVGIGVVAELKTRQSDGSPRSRRSSERDLGILPLSAQVSVFRSSGNAPVLPSGKFRIGIETVVQQRSHRSGEVSAAHHEISGYPRLERALPVRQHELAKRRGLGRAIEIERSLRAEWNSFVDVARAAQLVTAERLRQYLDVARDDASMRRALRSVQRCAYPTGRVGTLHQ